MQQSVGNEIYSFNHQNGLLHALSASPASFNAFPSLFSSPNLVGTLLPFGLRHPPRDKTTKNQSKRCKDVVDASLSTKSLVHDWKELRDDEGGHPVGGKCPTLCGTYCFGTDEFI